MIDFFVQNWGSVASLVGLGISVWVLVVAQKAKKAAEGARLAARLKSLVEVLEEARSRIQQAGLSLMNQEWGEARRLAEEVSNRSWQVSARWGDQLTRTARNNLMEAAEIAGSIASFAGESSMQQLDEEKWRRALDSYRDASKLISIVLGEAQKVEERTKR